MIVKALIAIIPIILTVILVGNFPAIWRWLKRLCRDFSKDFGAAIDKGDIRRIIQYMFFGILGGVGALGFVLALGYGIYINAGFLFQWIILPLLAVYVVFYWITSKPAVVIDETPDPVVEALARQRASEIYDNVRGAVYAAVPATANSTPIIRPCDEFEIETASPRGEHFYLTKERIPIFQFELGLENPIDKATEDLIQRELQNNITKQIKRFPMLISSEAQGRAPVELIDLRNMGGKLLAEIILCNTASIPLIEARRRARIERQQRSADTYDRDF